MMSNHFLLRIILNYTRLIKGGILKNFFKAMGWPQKCPRFKIEKPFTFHSLPIDAEKSEFRGDHLPERIKKVTIEVLFGVYVDVEPMVRLHFKQNLVTRVKQGGQFSDTVFETF